MPLGTYGGNAVLDAILNNTALAKTPYVSLHSGDPGLDGSNELSGSNYGRVAATIGAPTSGAASNSAAVTFPTASGDWSEATYFGVWDASTSGNFLGGAALDTSRTVLNGQYAEFAIGDLDITVATQFGNDVLDDIIDALFRNTSMQYTPYMSLHSADPGGTGASELANAESYARVAASFGSAAAKACANDANVDSPAATGDGWDQATHLGLWSSGTYGAGTFLWGKSLTVARTVTVGKFFRSGVGDISVTIT